MSRFPVDQQGKAFLEAEFRVRGWLRQLLFETIGHAGKPERAQGLQGLIVEHVSSSVLC
jgi:hypothetical protein